MRCIWGFLLVVFILFIWTPFALYIGFAVHRRHHPDKIIERQTRLSFNTTIVTTTFPITEKEDDKSDLYIRGSMNGGEVAISDNDIDSNEKKFRSKNDLVSETKLKIARLVTNKPIEAVREPEVSIEEDQERKEVNGFMKGEKTENNEEWKKASFESSEKIDKPTKALRVKEDDVNGSEESAEHYLIEENPKNFNSTKSHEESKRIGHKESNEHESSQKRGSQLDDEPGSTESHEQSKKQKEKILHTNRVSEAYDEMEEEELIVKTKKNSPKIVHDD